MRDEWKALARELLNFSALALFILMSARVVNLLRYAGLPYLRDHAAAAALFFLTGFRFDLKLVSTLLLLLVFIPGALLVWILSWKRLVTCARGGLLVALELLIVLVFVEFGYLLFFNRTIDLLVFGIIEDDTSAVVSSILGDHRLVALLLGTIVAMVLGAIGFLRLGSHRPGPTPRNEAPSQRRGSRSKGVAVYLLCVIVLFLPARGSLGTFPLRRGTAAVGNDSNLNALVINAPFNCYYAFRDRGKDPLRFDSAHLLLEAGVANEKELKRRAGYDIDHPLKVVTPQSPLREERAPIVIFVLMEGWSSHILAGDGPTNRVLGAFSKHLSKGYLFTRLLANHNGTNSTIENLLLSSPLSPLSQSRAASTPFSHSSLRPFKTQGYETVFLSGGYSSWRRHDQFWPLQGVDRYIGRRTIEKRLDVSANNPWGAYDGDVFRYLEEMLSERKNNDPPLFVFVLTTNNHPPVRLPPNYQSPPLDPSVYGFEADDSARKEMLRAFSYESNALGEFLDWIEDSTLSDRVILVATGDHPLRGFADYSRAQHLWQRYAVPAYFRVPAAYDRLQGVATKLPASHADLFPTLYEMALSEGAYLSFGEALMNKTRDDAYGWTSDGIFIFAEGMADSDSEMLFPWAGKGLVSPRGRPLTPWHKRIVQQERFRRLLKIWLLVTQRDATTTTQADAG